MKLIRDRAEARWLPSRHHLALFRLAAYLRLRRAAPRLQPGLFLAIDRDQTVAEVYTVSLAMLTLSSCFVGAALHSILPLAAAVIIAPVLSVTLMQVVMITAGLTATTLRRVLRHPPTEDNRSLNDVFLWLFLIASAGYFAQKPSSMLLQWLAFTILAAVVLNAVAAIVLRILRHRIQAAEQEYLAA